MKHTTIRLEQADHDALVRAAEKNGRTVAQEIRVAIRDYLHWLTGTAAAASNKARR